MSYQHAQLYTLSDLIGEDDDVAVSVCINAEIMAAVAVAAKVYPYSYEYANAFAAVANQPFAALQSLHRRSASVNAVVAEEAEFAYSKSFNDIEDDWSLAVRKIFYAK